jgi:hypothetical protein
MVMNPMTLLLLLFLIMGALLVGLSIPLILGRVKPNPWYGFRVRLTLESPEVWYPVNRYSGRWLLGVGLAEIAVATALYFVPGLEEGTYVLTVCTAMIAGLAVGLVQSFRYLQRYADKK